MHCILFAHPGVLQGSEAHSTRVVLFPSLARNLHFMHG